MHGKKERKLDLTPKNYYTTFVVSGKIIKSLMGNERGIGHERLRIKFKNLNL